MHYLDVLPYKDLPEERKKKPEHWEYSFVVHGGQWYVVDFQAISDVSDTLSLIICMSNNDNLITSSDQSLIYILKYYTATVGRCASLPPLASGRRNRST